MTDKNPKSTNSKNNSDESKMFSGSRPEISSTTNHEMHASCRPKKK